MHCMFDNFFENEFMSNNLEIISSENKFDSFCILSNVVFVIIALTVESMGDKEFPYSLSCSLRNLILFPICINSSTISNLCDEKEILYSHFIGDDSSNVPDIAIPISSFPIESEKHVYTLPPRIPAHISLVELLGFPLRVSSIVKPLPMPSNTRNASRKFDFPLALVPMNRFTRPNVRSTLRRLLKFSMTMRSIMFTPPRSTPASPRCRGGRSP